MGGASSLSFRPNVWTVEGYRAIDLNGASAMGAERSASCKPEKSKARQSRRSGLCPLQTVGPSRPLKAGGRLN